MLIMRERRKSKHKFGRKKVCKSNKVRKYFVNSKIENEVFGQCVNYALFVVWISEVMNFLFIAYESDEWCQFVVRIDSPELHSFYCVCFVSFYFSFYLFFCGFYYLLRYLGSIYLK